MKKRTARVIAMYEDNHHACDLLEHGFQLPYRKAIARAVVKKTDADHARKPWHGQSYRRPWTVKSR